MLGQALSCPGVAPEAVLARCMHVFVLCVWGRGTGSVRSGDGSCLWWWRLVELVLVLVVLVVVEAQ